MNWACSQPWSFWNRAWALWSHQLACATFGGELSGMKGEKNIKPSLWGLGFVCLFCFFKKRALLGMAQLEECCNCVRDQEQLGAASAFTYFDLLMSLPSMLFYTLR